jgi:branched-chain amino acid transport system permease protein
MILRPGRSALAIVIILGFLLVPLISKEIGQPQYVTLFSRILVYALGALSVNLLLSYAGLVSLGHAAFLGIGAYAVGIASFYGINSGFMQLALALLLAGGAGLAVGAVSVRVSGLHFIMITLAFAQLFYFLAAGLIYYGGDDGMTLSRRSTFNGLLNFNSPAVLYYTIVAVLLLYIFFLHRFSNSYIGMIIAGVRSNEDRMRALGYPTYRYKLIAFVISAMMCSVSGFLLANLNDFVSAQYMSWHRSGEFLIMIIFGGMHTLFGPIVGAAAVLLLEDVLSSYTDHWGIILGPILIMVIIYAERGIWGSFQRKSD